MQGGRFCGQGELVHPGKASGKNGLGGMLDIRAEPV